MDNYTLVRIFLIVLAVATLIVLIMRYNNKQGFLDSEGFYDADDDFLMLQNDILPKGTKPNTVSNVALTTRPPSYMSRAPMPTPSSPVAPAQPYLESDTGAEYTAVNYTDSYNHTNEHFQAPADSFPKDKLTADDLLPKDAANSKWSQVNPAGQGSVKDQNFLQAGYHVGLNTTQGTMKNANLQLRSDPPAPKMLVSPWLNSSYEPDLLRKPLEIGDTC